MKLVSRSMGLVGAAVVAVLALLASSAVASGPPPQARLTAPSAGASAKAPQKVDAYTTYYGWYDNTPPGCATAYSGCAKGKGTYADPITFASDKQEFPVGTILYYPTVEKYFVMGDSCQECTLDWIGKGPDGGPHLHHVDLWMGGKGGNEFDLINCEDALTQGLPDGRPLLTPFIRYPPKNLPVSPTPLFNAHTNHCFGGAVTSATHGRYQNKKTGECITEPGASPKPGTPAVMAKCTTGATQNLTYKGAFLVDHRLCLQTEGSKDGSHVDFARCNGNPREQWSINPNGTITWIQYTRCIAEAAGKVEMTACTKSPADHWSFHSEAAR